MVTHGNGYSFGYSRCTTYERGSDMATGKVTQDSETGRWVAHIDLGSFDDSAAAQEATRIALAAIKATR